MTSSLLSWDSDNSDIDLNSSNLKDDSLYTRGWSFGDDRSLVIKSLRTLLGESRDFLVPLTIIVRKEIQEERVELILI